MAELRVGVREVNGKQVIMTFTAFHAIAKQCCVIDVRVKNN